LNSYEYGFLIVISAYAKPQYISHESNDFGSILKFIEETFSLPPIGESVGMEYADSYALGDLSDCFNFNQTPLKFIKIQAPVDKNYFLHNKASVTPPDND
jgi:phospholipase C